MEYNSNTPIFSIIVPMYCGSQYVPNIIESIEQQGLGQDEWELILVDDASPDGSVYNLKEIVKLYDNVRLLVNKRNRRQGGARNHGVEKAFGKWIVYLDQDDTFEKLALCKLKKELEKRGDYDIIAVDLQFDKGVFCQSHITISIMRSDVLVERNI